MESAQRVAMEFFDLPLEEKQKLVSEPNTTPTNGYGRQFRKAKNRTDDWHDLFFQVHRPLTAKALEILPTAPAAYRYLQIHEMHKVLAWKEIICI
jgi:isopenicillin N synthase-like dioxygenase